jgi:segregation and condensation protein B
VSKRKKPNTASPPTAEPEENESVTTRATVPPEVLERAMGGGPHDEPTAIAADPRAPLETDPDAGFADVPDSVPPSESIDVRLDIEEFDAEMTVNLVGDLPLPGRDDLDAPTVAASGEAMEEVDRILLQRKHLRGLLEALVFASDGPIKPNELAKLAHAPLKQVKEHLIELKQDYSTRGVHLDEVAGGWVFRTSPQYAPFVRDLTKQKPVRLTRAQVETLAIIAYRQPITRPEVDDVRGVDTGPVLKLLLERDLVRILGKRDEPGRPLIYGTTGNFLEFFGLKSLKDLPTLREFTELSDESRDTFEDELGESPEDAARRAVEAEARVAAGEPEGTHGELGEHEDIQDEPDDRAPHESMRVPVGDHGDDDLEPLSGVEGVEPSEPEEPEEAHAADDDGPTLTSEAPSTKDE